MLTKLGKYQIRRELGRGAMGVVYEGFDPLIERAVAIKTIQKNQLEKSTAQETLHRFRREAQAAGRLAHPNIVAVYEYGEDAEVAYIAMEFVSGKELKDYFDRGVRFTIDDSMKIMQQLLSALEYSHVRGVVHRDIKPANILIAQDGQVKVADFGIAKIDTSDLTQAGTVLGTPIYMSPEQFMGAAVDRRSDIYSAGVILYQFLGGARPFSGGSATAIMHKVLHQEYVPLETSNPGVPIALCEVVKKAMARNCENRFQTAAEFGDALRSATGLQTVKQGAPQDLQPGKQVISQVLNFSMSDFEERLKESQREADRRSGSFKVQVQPDNVFDEINREFLQTTSVQQEKTVIAEPPVVKVSKLQAAPIHSSLLAGLAQEAKVELDSRQSRLHEKQSQERRVHDALNRIIQFLQPFIQHVNEVSPVINRTYRFDARTVYSNLKWQKAVVEFRKQSLSEEALNDYVSFSVNMCAPTPVLLRRPWGSLETLKNELFQLRLRLMDNQDSINLSKKQKQEWLETELAPDFPVQIRFQGNYRQHCIDVTCRNLGEFGSIEFKLDPDQVTVSFLEELGVFLLGRSDKLPVPFRKEDR